MDVGKKCYGKSALITDRSMHRFAIAERWRAKGLSIM